MSDPYNRDGPSEALIAAMEQAWKACCSRPSTEPLYFWIPVDTSEMLQGRRSHTLEPYADRSPSMRAWWRK